MLARFIKSRKKKDEVTNTTDDKLKCRKRVFNVNQEKLLDHYEVQDLIGKGSFSVVRKGRHKSGLDVAIKIIDKTSIDVKIENLQTEVQILMNIHHPNIVNLVDVFEDDDHVYLVMDLMSGGELFERLCTTHPNGYPEKEAQVMIRKIASVVQYFHSKGIIHRDLKPENLLFSDKNPSSEIKVSDFGLAKIWHGDMLVKTACGSPNYVAPEVLLNKHRGYSFAVDMWSLGVILYVIMCGYCPFYNENTPLLFKTITKGIYSFPSPEWDNISVDCKDLISHLLIVNPEERYTPTQCLQHPWLAE